MWVSYYNIPKAIFYLLKGESSPPDHASKAEGYSWIHLWGTIRAISGLYGDNGKDSLNYYNYYNDVRAISGYMGIMEKKMETTILGYITLWCPPQTAPFRTCASL